MDLTPTAYTLDVDADGTLDSGDGDKAWVFLGMRRGGYAYYALDVSNPESPEFLWTINCPILYGAISVVGPKWGGATGTCYPV